MMTTIPTHLYVGRREAVIAEVGTHLAIYSGKYLICPVGEPDFDVEGAANKRELAEFIRQYRNAYPNIEVIRV